MTLRSGNWELEWGLPFPGGGPLRRRYYWRTFKTRRRSLSTGKRPAFSFSKCKMSGSGEFAASASTSTCFKITLKAIFSSVFQNTNCSRMSPPWFCLERPLFHMNRRWIQSIGSNTSNGKLLLIAPNMTKLNF